MANRMTIPILLAVLTHAAAVSNALLSGTTEDTFNLDVSVASGIQAIDNDFAVFDSSGFVILKISPVRTIPAIGSRIRVQGHIRKAPFGHCVAVCTEFTLVGAGEPPPVPDADFDQILAGACDARLVRTGGMLRDYFTDEIDPKYLFLILNRNEKTLYVAVARHSADGIRRLDDLLGRDVTLTGLCDPFPSGSRRKIGRLLRINDLDALITSSMENSTPTQSSARSSNGRCRLTGHVIAVWNNNALLLQTHDGSISRVDLAKGNPPSFGDTVEVIGFPETDLFRRNFSRASWRPADTTQGTAPAGSVADISSKALHTNFEGKRAFNPDFHGRTVRLRGIVRSLPSIGYDGRFYLESDGYTLPVDISANPVLAEKLEIGSVIDLTGVCVMDIENWRPNLVFPHIKEVMIVTRTPDDIVVIRRPPWWTPARLSIVIGSLLAALLGILIWNRALKALAEKCGKALANEELERLESDLKVCERTRLAVELHDSIAQNLTGVSMEIDTALRGYEPLPPAAAQHMGRALRTIDSCRGELRNCLWDLRSQALEEDDMNKAIRLTLSQTIGKANLIVRFNVPRSRFTDNTAHTLLRIIRELAANAVRHGKATEIRVAGSIEDNILKFSVRDNGCGFDPDACPGVLDGHFGLQGVRERVASFEGSIRIESIPGKGTRVSVSINAPQGNDKEKL